MSFLERRSVRSLFIGLGIASVTWSVVGLATDSPHSRPSTPDRIETTGEQLQQDIDRYERVAASSKTSNWRVHVDALDQRLSAMRSSYGQWARLLDEYIPEHLDDCGAPTMSRLQISIRDWLADQEAFVTAVHACVDPLGLPVDTAAASACVNQFVIAHTSEFEQHQQRVNAAIRDARRDGLTD